MADYTSRLALKEMKPVGFKDVTTSPWDAYRGQQPYYSPDMLDPEAKKLTSAPDLPVALEGYTINVPQLVEELVATTDNWYTLVLPLEFVNEIEWETNVTSFDVRMPRNTPYKTSSRILNSRTTFRNGKLERHGIMFEMEANFMDTPRGKAHYAFTLNQMANSVIMLLNVGVIRAYLNCDNYHAAWEKEHGMRVSTDIYEKLNREIEMFAIVQKTKHGLKKLDAMVSEHMTAYQGVADTWILPPMLKMYNDLVPPENTDYYIAGPKGPLHVDDATTVRYTLNGNKVYLSRMIDDTSEFGQRNLLARTVEIGSYNTLVDIFKNNQDSYWESDYSSKHRMIKVYDEDRNDNTRIGLYDLLENCYNFDQNTGLPILPENKSLYSSDPSDRKNDMLSYPDDNNPSWRKPVRLFGHISESHFSVNSLVKLCLTIQKYQSRQGGISVSTMESILNDGLELVDKINKSPIHLPWFFNVYYEHLRLNGVTQTVNISDKDEYEAFIKKITALSKRSKSTMRVFKGLSSNAMSLPRYDYYSALDSLGDPTNPKTDKDIQDEIAKNPTAFLGGSCLGALVGYGTWDGFLMLQRELSSGGGGAPGFTKHGYLVDDCKKADKFISLVRSLVDVLSFLFDNTVFLDKNKASSLVEDPSKEHVLAEWILGLTGIPVFMDASKISILNKPAKRVTRGLDFSDAPKLVKSATEDYDRQNQAIVNSLLQWVETSIKPTSASDATALEKKIKTYFQAIYADAFGLKGDDKKYPQNNDLLIFLKKVFPLSSVVNVNTFTYAAYRLRTIALYLISEYILKKKMSTDNKKKALNSYLDYIGDVLGIKSQLNLIPDYDTLAGEINALTYNVDKPTIQKLSIGVTGVWYDPKDIRDLEFDTIVNWFVEHAQTLKINNESLKSTLDTLYRDYEAAVQQDAELKSSEYPTLMHALELAGEDLSRAAVRGGNEPSSLRGPQGSRGMFISGLYDDPVADSTFYDEGPGKGYDERFFRSPLVISAKQALDLHGKMKVDRSAQTVMNLRLADPSDIERYIDVPQMKTFAKKIKRVNNLAQSKYSAGGRSEDISVSDVYESPLIFFSENMKARQKALAMSGFGRSSRGTVLSVRGSSLKVKKRPVTAVRRNVTGADDVFGAQPPYKRRRREEQASFGLNVIGSSRDLPHDSDDDYRNMADTYGERDYRKGSAYGVEEESDDGDEYEQVERNATNLSLLRKQIGQTRGDDHEEDLNSNLMNIYVKIDDATNSKLTQLIGKVYLTSLVTYGTLEKFIKHNILFPFGGLAFRPHMRYESYCGIKTLAGASTGKTFVAHTGLARQNDAATKTHLAHFTLHDDSVIFRPKQVYVQYNIFISKCLGGAGFNPMNPYFYNTRTGETRGGCVIYVLIPYEETEFHNYMDVTGRFLEGQGSAGAKNFIDPQNMNFPHYSQCWRANQIWRFRGEDQIGADDMISLDSPERKCLNTVVIQAQQYNFSLATNDHTELITNKGHLGPEGPGSRDARNGGLKSFDSYVKC